MVETKSRNCSIDIFRIICAVMIVAIHTSPLSEFNSTAGFVFSQVLTRIAVPFFFCTSGYFYISKALENKNSFKTAFLRILSVYIIWTIIYYLFDAVLQIVSGTFTIKTLFNYVINFIIYGSAAQFWFFPALLFSIVVISVLKKFNLLKFGAYFSLILYIIGLLGTSYTYIGAKIPVLNTLIASSFFTPLRRILLMGLPFYFLGYFVKKINEKISDKAINILSIVSFIGFIAEIFVVKYLLKSESVVITVFLYPLTLFVMLWLLRHPLPSKKNLANYTRGCANFVFYVHILLILILKLIAEKSGIVIQPTVLFISVTLVSILLGMIIVKINNKHLNKLIF